MVLPLLVVGASHHTAGIALRERLAMAPEHLPAALDGLRKELGCPEVAILSTCNRTEIYCVGEPALASRLVDWLARERHVEAGELRQACYARDGVEALRHMMRVASGLDSLVLGEPQVLGQVKDAYALAHRAGTVGRALEPCFQQVFAVAKRVRTETAIGANPVSVAFAAVSLAKHLFSDIAGTRALLIGAGEMIDLVARHLAESGVREIVVANRTLERAHALADQVQGRAITLEEIAWALEQADIVVSCTAAMVPVVGKGTVERAQRRRRHRPLFIVDLAVPRDVEPEVGELEDVYLYTVDALQGVIDDNRRAREAAARAAEALVAAGSDEYLRHQREQGAGETLRHVRGAVERLREAELARAREELARGGDPGEVMARMSRALVNKLLHAPSVTLREAAADGRDDLLAFARRLFPGDGRGNDDDNDNGNGSRGA
jgi:glutamyl-tRNA reductase